MFLLVQLYGLGLSRPGKWMLAAPFIAVLAIFYGIYPEYLIGLARLPMIMYIGTFTMFAIVWILMRTVNLFRRV